MNEMLEKLKTTPEIKRILYDTDLLIITLGYNDLLYHLALEENKNQNSLEKEMKEIEIVSEDEEPLGQEDQKNTESN